MVQILPPQGYRESNPDLPDTERTTLPLGYRAGKIMQLRQIARLTDTQTDNHSLLPPVEIYHVM